MLQCVGDTAVSAVWLADQPDSTALLSWRTGTGRHRHVGHQSPRGAELVEPSVEDAYLLMLGRPAIDDLATADVAVAS